MDALVDTVVWLLPFGILLALVVLWKRTGYAIKIETNRDVTRSRATTARHGIQQSVWSNAEFRWQAKARAREGR